MNKKLSFLTIAAGLAIVLAGSYRAMQARVEVAGDPGDRNHLRSGQSFGGAINVATAGTEARLGAITSVPLNDSLQFLDAGSFGGKIASCYNLYKVPPEHFIVLHQVQAPGVAARTTTYEVENTAMEALDQPQFSPDGRFLALRLGTIDSRNPNYHLYVLDTQQNTLHSVPTRPFSVPIVSWSPDGCYLAYVLGGDRQGIRWYSGRQLQLMVVDWRSGKSRLIAEDDNVKRGFSWAWPHTLFYSAQAKPGPQRKRQSAVPAIYQADAAAGKPQLLLSAAYDPVVSPSGQWIAFCSSLNQAETAAKSWELDQAPRWLGVAMRDGTHRHALGRAKSRPFVLWLHDDRHLLSVEHISDSPNLKAQVRKCDIGSGRWQDVGSLSSHDSLDFDIDTLSAWCQPRHVSSDGSTLFCNTAAVLGKDKEKPDSVAIAQRLLSLDLASGQASTMATGRSQYSRVDSFFDFHEEASLAAHP